VVGVVPPGPPGAPGGVVVVVTHVGNLPRSAGA
jgi:hypothetical protein